MNITSSNSPLSELRFKITIGICWLILMVNQAIVLHWCDFPWQEAIVDSVISNIILLLPCLLIINTIRFYLPQKDRFFNIFVCCVVLTAITMALSKLLLLQVLGYHENYETFLTRSLPIRFSIAFLVLGCITMISVVWYYWMEHNENDIRKAAAEKLAKDAELFKLRQQLHPHFLFNSLNSINALIGQRPAEARKMVQQLSDFLRGTLKKDDSQWVQLSEELQHLQLYLDIEQLRFGDRLITNITKDETVAVMQLPVLLLQPIVENAIKFGLYDTLGKTAISISAWEEEERLIIEVSNPFDPDTVHSQQGTGFGLSSVQRRLYLLFARNDLMQTSSTENTFITRLIIPQLAETSKAQ